MRCRDVVVAMEGLEGTGGVLEMEKILLIKSAFSTFSSSC